MKKFIFMLMLAVSIFTLASCSCDRDNKDNGNLNSVKDTLSSLIVENTISVDREYMYLNYGDDYRWFETTILMKDYMDGETTTGEVEAITSVFQVIREKGKGYDTKVVMSKYTANSHTIDVIDGFWVEDFPINDEDLVLTFDQAYNKAMNTNIVKPHSRYCVIRKEVGPKNANVQYIFGNVKYQVYVDAVTGEVTEHNPVLNGPLGEWP